MLNDKVSKGLNRQINRELYSAYLYLSMASYASSIGLNGFANWFNVQVKEELSHADKMYNYMIQQGSKVMLEDIEKPKQDFKSALELFETTLGHEQKVTAMINNLVDIADKERDHATAIFLQWFVTEQIEEEENANDILQKLRLIGKEGNGLFMLDNQLATRVFVLPQSQV